MAAVQSADKLSWFTKPGLESFKIQKQSIPIMWKLYFQWRPSNRVKVFNKPKSEALKNLEQPHDLEYSMRYFLAFGKIIGLYPSKFCITKLLPFLLAGVTIVDWIGYMMHPPPPRTRTAAEIFGAIGSPQFYSLGTFCYFYIQTNHKKLTKIYEKWLKIPVSVVDTRLTRFVNLVAGGIMASAILENITFHFKLFPVFESPIQNETSFEVYYMRSHGFWSYIIPFTPYHATMLLIANKLALYAWNFSDILATVTCRALRFHFDVLHDNTEVLGPKNTVQRYEELINLMRSLVDYLSPLVFGCFYLDFYALCMQLHMWVTPSQHQHFLHTIYLLWAFVHLLVRIFLLTFQASRLHETSAKVHDIVRLRTDLHNVNVRKQLMRIDCTPPPKRQLAVSGLGCFFITKHFILSLIYVAFTFEIFLVQSDGLSLTCF